MDRQTAKRRLAAVAGQLKHRKIDCMLITSPENVRYLTGFTGEDSWVIIAGSRVYFITDSRYTEQAAGECAGCRIIERTETIAQAAADLIKKLKVGTVAIESTCAVATLMAVKKALKRNIKPVGGAVEAVRQIKDKYEAACIKRAGRIAWEALDYTLKHISTGMTENEVAAMLDYRIRRLGAVVGFETILAFGANGSRNHHQPGQRKLRKNDTVLIDFGARINGYTSDVTRTFVFGKAGRFFEKVYYAVADAQRRAISMVKAGADILAIDTAARDVIAQRGLDVYKHGTGHGIGLLIHEDPYISKKSKGTLKAGQVITIEPGVYLPGRFGVRIEDDVLVTENGCKILTKDERFGFGGYQMPVLTK